MTTTSPAADDDHPLAAAGAAAARAPSQPPVSNPAESLFDGLAGMAPYADAPAGATAWSSHYYPPPPCAPTATTSGGFNSSPSPSPSTMLYRSMTDTFYPRPTVAAETPPYCWYHQTQPGFPPRFAPPFAHEGVMPPPVLGPTPITRAEPSRYHTHNQDAAASGSEAQAAAAVVHAVPDAQKAQEATAPAPRRRGRPRKTDAAAAAGPKPVIKKPKRATTTAPNSRAAAPTASSVAGGSAAMACQVQIHHQQQGQAAGGAVQVQVPQHKDQVASVVVAGATSDQHQMGTTTNPMALLRGQKKQWHQLLPPITCSNDLSARDRAAAAGPYADTSVAGVRFQPTDEELIFFLRLKHAGHKMPVGVDFFKDFDVYHEHPETSRAACGVVNGCWYAFSPRNRKYKNGDRPARSVLDASGVQVGYWKSNTKLATVRAGGGALVVGVVTSLTFHLGRQPKGTQTPWKMKEYSIPQNQHAPDGSAMRLNDWVVCKLFYKERVVKKGKNAVAAAAAAAAGAEDPSSEAGENDFWPEGDEGAWMESAAQTLGNCERDLCAEFYQIGTSDADNFSAWM